MGKYIVKRILQVIPMLFILSLIVFMMVRLIPGDPVDMMLGMDIPKDTKEYERERLGLNDPLYIQYFRFVGNALHGDLGTSIFSGKPVVEELAKRFPKTLTLAVGGTLFGAAVGVLLGIIAAIHRNKFADNLIMVLSLLTVSTPSFFLALILMLIFCLNLRWLPSIGMDTWQGAVLPIATLGLQAIGSIARTTRSAMLDVIHQDYPHVSFPRRAGARDYLSSCVQERADSRADNHRSALWRAACRRNAGGDGVLDSRHRAFRRRFGQQPRLSRDSGGCAGAGGDVCAGQYAG